ncbi:MAG: hypothetical protein ACJ768_04410 [Gaiellaceae bacterium]
MSHVHPPHHVHHLGLSRRSLTWLVAVLVVAAAITVTLIVAIGNDDNTASSSTSSPAPVTQTGPNESLRGQSAAAATGGTQVVQQSLAGPNETLRGQAAAGQTP